MANQDKSYLQQIGAYGQLVVLSGPIGVGKRTIREEYLKLHEHAIKLPTVTTRGPREGEVEGVDHYYVTYEQFDRMIRSHQLVDYDYYNRVGYGTTKKSIEDARAAGRDVLMIEDMVGAMRVKAQYDDAVLIFFLTPTWEELEDRIRARKSAVGSLEDRLFHAQEQILCADQFDYVVVNDKVENAVRRLYAIIHGNRYSKPMMKDFLESYVKSEIDPIVVNELK